MSVQSGAGSWNYHRDEPQHPETCSMTAAGVGSLLICQRQLDRYRQTRRGTSTLLKLARARRDAGRLSPVDLQRAARPGHQARHVVAGCEFRAEPMPPSPVKRLTTCSTASSGSGPWPIVRLSAGSTGTRKDVISSCRPSMPTVRGIARTGIEMNTVWAILFLTKSTAKTIKRIQIKRLGAGTLLGGRELPKDLSSMTVAGGRVVSRPMNGAIEGMLAVLEDPRAEQADAAVAGMVERYYREGPDALRPFKSRFRKMLSDRDPGVQKVGAWALAHTGDLAVVPLLIDVLAAPNQDEEVVAAARLGLQLLSRKIDGLGPPSPSTSDERQAAGTTVARMVRGHPAARPRRSGRRHERGNRSREPPSRLPRHHGARRDDQAAQNAGKTDPSEPELEPKVLGESRYDQVTSLLMAVVLGAILVVGWLALVYVSNQAYASRVTAPLQIIEVYGGGGGSPEGTPGSTEKIDVAGADAAAAASNNEEAAGDFEEPVGPADSGRDARHGGRGRPEPGRGRSGGRHAQRRGRRQRQTCFQAGVGRTGAGLRAGRWRRLPRTALEHHLQRGSDDRRICPPARCARCRDGRRRRRGPAPVHLPFLECDADQTPWPRAAATTGFISSGKVGDERRPTSRSCKKAGVEVGEGNVFQFYPPEAERRLSELEVRYKGRQPGEIRVTRFTVVPNGNTYDFQVVAQETLR